MSLRLGPSPVDPRRVPPVPVGRGRARLRGARGRRSAGGLATPIIVALAMAVPTAALSGTEMNRPSLALGATVTVAPLRAAPPPAATLSLGSPPPSTGARRCPSPSDCPTGEAPVPSSSRAAAAGPGVPIVSTNLSVTGSWNSVPDQFGPYADAWYSCSSLDDGQRTYDMAYDPAEGIVVWIGENATYNETTYRWDCPLATWTYAAGAWSPLRSAREPTDPFGALAYDPSAGTLLYVGGNSTWSFRAGNWSELNTTAEPRAYGIALAYDPSSEALIAFGGIVAGSLTDTPTNASWVFTDGTWYPLRTGHAPPARAFASLAYDRADHQLLLFGGTPYPFIDPYSSLNDTWSFSGGDWRRIPTATAPPATAYSPLAYDAEFGRAVLFDRGAYTVLTESWAFRAGNWTLLSRHDELEPQRFAAMTFDARDGYLFAFVGWGAYNDSQSGYSYALGWTAPELSLRADRASADLGQSVSFLAVASERVPGVTFGDRWATNAFAFGCGAEGTARFNCTPTAPGAYGVLLNLTDSGGGWLVVATDYTVYSDPVLYGPESAARWADVGQPIVFQAGATGGAGGYLFRWTPPTSAHCAPATSGALDCSFYEVGTGQATVQLTDANGVGPPAASSPLLIVYPELRAPAPTATALQIEVDRWVTLEAIALGGNTSHPYNFTWMRPPPGCRSIGNGLAACRLSNPGLYAFQYSVTDSGGFYAVASGVTNLSVYGPLDLGTMNVTPAEIDLGQSATFSDAVRGGPVGAPWTLWIDLPPGCYAGPLSGNPCVPQATGTYGVYVLMQAPDGESAVARPAELTVNPWPAFGPLDPSLLRGVAGQPLELEVPVVGGSAPVNLSPAVLPPGCGWSGSDRLSCRIASPGNYSVEIVATDATGARATADFTLSFASEPPPAPSPRSSPAGLGPLGVVAAGIALVAAGVALAFLASRLRRRPPGGAPAR
jgi:hypothetical protein